MCHSRTSHSDLSLSRGVIHKPLKPWAVLFLWRSKPLASSVWLKRFCEPAASPAATA